MKLIFVIAGIVFLFLINKLVKKFWKHTGGMFLLVNLIKGSEIEI